MLSRRDGSKNGPSNGEEQQVDCVASARCATAEESEANLQRLGRCRGIGVGVDLPRGVTRGAFSASSLISFFMGILFKEGNMSCVRIRDDHNKQQPNKHVHNRDNHNKQQTSTFKAGTARNENKRTIVMTVKL